MDAELKKLAAKANGETWAFLTKTGLTPEEQLQMLSCAYTSLYLWKAAGGTALHFARAHWLLCRVCCVLKNPFLAEQHAELCKSYTDRAGDKKNFDIVYAVEALARVAALQGASERARQGKAEALRLAAVIADVEDRQIAEGDIVAEPWFGV